MKILLLSAYNTHSHNYWAKLLMEKVNEADWTFLELPPRKFSWRIRGNPLSWHASRRDILEQDYDTILATSMVDLATLLGLFPNLAKANKVVYFHENQFEYPQSEVNSSPNVEAMMVNLYSAMAADKVLFNSEFNRTTFLSAARTFLKKINDESPASVMDAVESKSSILPVPIRSKDHGSDKISSSIVWNHRWEYDKKPEDFYKALKILKNRGLDFKLMILGIQFKNYPKVFDRIKEDFADEILCWGFQEKEDYVLWLKQAEFVISTAIHEFQGLAVMEAVQLGAIPVVPDRLSYPQWFSKEYRYSNTVESLADHLETCLAKKNVIPDIDHITWENLSQEYKNILIK